MVVMGKRPLYNADKDGRSLMFCYTMSLDISKIIRSTICHQDYELRIVYEVFYISSACYKMFK
jgi:hypothetical protein